MYWLSLFVMPQAPRPADHEKLSYRPGGIAARLTGVECAYNVINILTAEI